VYTKQNQSYDMQYIHQAKHVSYTGPAQQSNASPQPKVKETLKLIILGIQGHSKSSMMAPLKSSSLLLVMIGSTSVSNCNCFHTKRTNSGKITIFRGTRI